LDRHTLCVAKSVDKKTPDALLCGQRLKEYQGRLSQEAYAAKLNMLSSTLGNYLQGIRTLGIYEAKIAGAALGVPAAYLLGVIDETDRDILMAPKEKKMLILALLKSEEAHQQPGAVVASKEAPNPEHRVRKSRSKSPGQRKRRKAA
jgi:transcriptional regulator with XRE-family HTH domain